MTNIPKSVRSKCNHPGCAKEISRNKPQGVCYQHLHMTGCRCDQCASRDARSARLRARGVVQVATVADASTSFGTPATMMVSLPLAPWERVG